MLFMDKNQPGFTKMMGSFTFKRGKGVLYTIPLCERDKSQSRIMLGSVDKSDPVSKQASQCYSQEEFAQI